MSYSRSQISGMRFIIPVPMGWAIPVPVPKIQKVIPAHPWDGWMGWMGLNVWTHLCHEHRSAVLIIRWKPKRRQHFSNSSILYKIHHFFRMANAATATVCFIHYCSQCVQFINCVPQQVWLLNQIQTYHDVLSIFDAFPCQHPNFKLVIREPIM